MQLRHLYGSILLFAFSIALAQPSTVNDELTCSDRKGQLSIDACTRLISSGRFDSKELARTYAIRGMTYRDGADYDRAIADFTQVIQLLEKSSSTDVVAAAYVVRANAHVLKGDLQKALADYRRAAVLDDKNAEATEGLRQTETAVAAISSPISPPNPCGGSTVVSLPTSRGAQPLSAVEECSLRPKDSFKECVACPEMIVVPAGSFTMGSPEREQGRNSDEGPRTVITIVKPFAVGKFEVTRAEFERFVSSTGYSVGVWCRVWSDKLVAWDNRSDRSFRNPGFRQDSNHPVVCVSWDDAKAYVQWLQRTTGKQYRLLSEAEWEYVARAGSQTQFWWGPNVSTEEANYDGRA